MGVLRATGDVLPIMYASQVLTGVMLLSRRFVPLVLIVIAPITTRIQWVRNWFRHLEGCPRGDGSTAVYLVPSSG